MDGASDHTRVQPIRQKWLWWVLINALVYDINLATQISNGWCFHEFKEDKLNFLVSYLRSKFSFLNIDNGTSNG